MAISNSSFKEYFFSFANYLGNDARVLRKHIGPYDDIDENEQRAFIYFKNYKVNICVSSANVVESIASPIADTFGHPAIENSDFYSLDGVVQGMTKTEIKRIWGNPDNLDNPYCCYWTYSKRGGVTANENRYDLWLEFSENNSGLFLSNFVVRLVKTPYLVNNNISAKQGNNWPSTFLHYLLIFLNFFFVNLGKLGSWLVKISLNKLRDLLKL